MPGLDVEVVDGVVVVDVDVGAVAYFREILAALLVSSSSHIFQRPKFTNNR